MTDTEQPTAIKITVVGTRLYAQCPACNKLVQVNKFIVGSLHVCN